MAIARYVDGQVVDHRGDVNLEDVPPHKKIALEWKALIYTGSGDVENVSVDGDTITITRTPEQPGPNHVKAEAQRRIIVRTGANDLTECMIKQLNANMRANELNDIRHSRVLTPEEQAEAEVLRVLAADIKNIRAKSNTIEAMAPIPMDYANDSYWT